MQVCLHCGTQNREGVIYCEKCGIALMPLPLSTRQLPGSSTQSLGGMQEIGPEGLLILQVANEDTPITVQMRHDVILGRATQQSETTTYINLTPYGGDEAGVSRQHARLIRDNRAIYLVDLNSTNGTRLNGELLAASVERRLRDGDEIMLGRLKIYVYFTA